MICFSVVVFSVFSLALGGEPLSPSSVTNLNHTSLNTEETNPNVVGVCYFGRFPSARCMFRCFLKSKSAVCDEEARCLCKSQEDRSLEESLISQEYNYTAAPTTVAPAPVANSVSEVTKNETDPATENRRVIFYIFDLNRIFGDDNGTTLPTISHILPKGTSRTVQGVWTAPHLLAGAILLLLAILVVLEVLNFCKRRSSKQNFRQAMLTTPVSEKAFINDKQ